MNGIERMTPEEIERTIGITTTIPAEAIFAAGLQPLDLNNLFITSGIAPRLVEEAEQSGFPRNSCSWNKGLFSTARRLGLKRVAAVVQGDCANTHALVEMLRAESVEIVPFAFPYSPADSALLDLALDRFAAALGTTRQEAEEWKAPLDRARSLAHRMDELNWRENRATGEEQHLWTISCSDFFGDPERYAARASERIAQCEARPPQERFIRLGLIGVPPICDGFFAALESRGARVVFNEIPRQFAMPHATRSLVEQYLRYTYPYDIFHRLADIREQLALRRVQGLIHYVQSFCFRQVQDTIVRRELRLPILTLECDRPGPPDMRTQTRIEAFLEMLRG
jgi:benzoyl-CoA reductase/2-hydroxyglutaryl-CoA dehydratase subunit BcrC/BadD/HgdB